MKETDCRDCINCLRCTDGEHCVKWYRIKDDEYKVDERIINPIGSCEDYLEAEE